MFKFCLQSGLLCIVAACVGCGEPDYYTLSGTVTKDGQPLPYLQISLMPESPDSTRPPMCLSKEDGSFIMRTGRESGVPPGKYTVWVQDPAEVDGGRTPKESDDFYDNYMYVIERYSPDNSEMIYTADAHQSSYELKLEEMEYTKEKIPLGKTGNSTDDPT